MIPSLSFLQDKLTVKALDDGLVSVSIVFPADLLNSFCHFLESLNGFFWAVDRQSSFAQAQARIDSEAFKREAQACLDAYRERLVKAFDDYEAQGLERKEIHKRISADLRAESHPWRSVDLVRSTLVAAGRDGRRCRPRRGES